MAQVPKEHVRASMVAAAAALFADAGYEAATMGAVAERAGTSIGNLYKYFSSKEELFAAAVPEVFAADLQRRTRERIEALGIERDVRALAPDARYHVLAEDLLAHCLANRERVVILLARADGTPFASFAEDFARRLVDWALAYAQRAYPTLRPTPALRHTLRRVYASYLSAIADALVTFPDEARTREVVAHLTAHHQGGLRHLFETAAREGPAREGPAREGPAREEPAREGAKR